MARGVVPDERRCRGLRFAKRRDEPLIKPCRSYATVGGVWCQDCSNDRARIQSLLDALKDDWSHIVKGGKKRKGGRPSAWDGWRESDLIREEEAERLRQGLKAPLPDFDDAQEMPTLPANGAATGAPAVAATAAETAKRNEPRKSHRPAGPVPVVSQPAEALSTPQTPSAYQARLDTARAHLERQKQKH